MKLFGTDGIRGIAGEELCEELARKVGNAVGRMLCEGDLPRLAVIGYDTRESSEWLCSALCSGLTAAGCDALVVGVAPTPTVAYLTTELKAGAGVVISASHNPWEYNGIKIFGHDGRKLPDAWEEQIERSVLYGKEVKGDATGRVKDARGATELYISYALLAAGAELSGMRIGVDLANGATVSTAIRALEAAGAECVVLADKPNGRNINDRCGSTHTESLAHTVTELGLDCGVAFDGDGDRLIAVDGYGREVNGDRILGVIAPSLIARSRARCGTVVGTVMTNPGLTSYLMGLGIRVARSRVGDRFVSELMQGTGAILGGESSGHIIFSELMTTGDGLLTALILLRTVKESGASLSALADRVPIMPERTVSLAADAEKRSRLSTCSAIWDKVREYEHALGDKVLIVVRASGTEPCIRITVSAATAELVDEICSELSRLVESL